jgi:hypothetical protein
VFFSKGKEIFSYLKKEERTGCQWLTPVIPATWEAEIWRIAVQSQLRDIV